MSHYIYIVKCSDGTLYTGYTNDLQKRINAHNNGTGAKYTKTRRPVELVYSEEFETKTEAMSREWHIKHDMSREEKIRLIEGKDKMTVSFEYYQNKLNDIITKCPIESGVEILVYQLLEEIVTQKNVSLISIDRLKRGSDNRLETEGGIPDLAIVSKDFEFNSKKGDVYCFIEVKAAHKKLYYGAQIKGQRKKGKKHIFTNGIVWDFGDEKIRLTEKESSLESVSLDSEMYDKLKKILTKYLSF